MPDPDDWLTKLTADEWIRAAVGELSRAEKAYEANNLRGGIAGCKRAAGMALNAMLRLEPNPAWGRTYVEHVTALASEEGAPAAVREACKTILGAESSSSMLVTLRTPKSNDRVLDAARDVMRHAYAIVQKRKTP